MADKKRCGIRKPVSVLFNKEIKSGQFVYGLAKIDGQTSMKIVCSSDKEAIIRKVNRQVMDPEKIEIEVIKIFKKIDYV